MKSVAILGCGPAGLLAAHAAVLSGWDFRVYSRKQRSQLYGAQYLHQPIPNLDCGTPALVHYELRGTPEAYRRKVYGDSWDGTVSPEDFMETHSAWDIRRAYRNLWELYHTEIEAFDFTNTPAWMLYEDLAGKQTFTSSHDIVISTVPRKLWAEPGDVFESQRIWALGDTEERRVNGNRPPDFTVVCSADVLVPWYRVSNIYGYATMEWPYDYEAWEPEPPSMGASIVEKPLRHNSTAASDFHHVGRYGKWEKGVLSSDAFYDAMKTFAEDSIA